jgi:hypothetical protein
MKSIVLIFLAVIGLYACAPQNVSTSRVGDYDEDLSKYRPKFETEAGSSDPGEVTVENPEKKIEVAPSNDITGPINSYLDTLAVRNAKVNYVEGYTVLVYTGTNREEANQAKLKVLELIPDSNPILKFESPSYKVKVGKFYNRLEAHRIREELTRQFPKSIIVPERIYLNI